MAEGSKTRKAACISADQKYRYWLTRIWDDSLPMLCVMGVNPSTADHEQDDPTIRKVIGFATRLGFGSVLMLNVGAYRATNPRQFLQAADPFGPENSIAHLREYIAQNTMACREGEIPAKGVTAVVAAWGKNGHANPRVLNRCLAIAHAIPDLFCWGRNSDSSPRHPLMLPYTTKLELLAGGTR